MMLRETLHAMADQAPAPVLPEDLFDRAKRRHRRRQQWGAVAAVLLILVMGYALSPTKPFMEEPAAGPPGLPSRVYQPSRFTEEFSHSPNGPASLVFWGPAVPDEPFPSDFTTANAIVGLTTDTYRVAYTTQASTALSPDGRTLLIAHNDGGGMASSHWRTDVIDLATGKAHPFAPTFEPVGFSTDGKHLLLVAPDRWDHENGPVETINDDFVQVVSWPDGTSEWAAHIARPEAVEGESNFFFALSPDATKLAVSTSRQLRVYGSDGKILWHRDAGWSLVAGPAAWRDNTHLAVMRRDLSGADAQWYDASHWRLEYVDPATGDPVTGPTYPVLGGAYDVQVVAWRGETAYAVARFDPHAGDDKIRTALVRLAPGASGVQDVLTMPPGVRGMGVATDYVDQVRDAGTPEFGMNMVQVLKLALTILYPTIIVGLIGFALWRWRRHRREARLWLIPPAP
jgi:hypothetical protein